METIVKTQGITCHFIPTDKFKTNTLVFKMKAPLRRETATMRALLPHVLQSATHTYPSMTEVRSRLEELYGATLNVDLQKKENTISFPLRWKWRMRSFYPEPLPY